MKKIIAKFGSTCHGSGLKIKKGEEIFYNYETRRPYKIGHEPKEGPQTAGDNDAGRIIEAQEEVFYDNFCSQNNI